MESDYSRVNGGNMIILRTYEYVANVYHWCDRCCDYINPGECYEGSVRVLNGRLIVFKTHCNPSCDYPPDPEDFDESEKKSYSEEQLKLAA